MEKRVREAIRYLGFGKTAVDDRTFALIIKSFKELEEIKQRRHNSSSVIYGVDIKKKTTY